MLEYLYSDWCCYAGNAYAVARRAWRVVGLLYLYAKNAYTSMTPLVEHNRAKATKSRLTLLTLKAENAYNSMNTLVEQSLAQATKRRLTTVEHGNKIIKKFG